MSFLASVGAWLTDPARWTGSDGITVRVLEHVQVTGTALAIAALLALPLGVTLGHLGRGGFLALNVAGFGRAIPSLALLVIGALAFGLSPVPVVVAMVALGVPPMITNAFVGVRHVDRDVIDAARGMGLSGLQVLRQVELRLAAPVILAGVRSAAVAIVATATLGALVAGGGLGRYIVDGLALQEYERVFAGALLVALLAVAVEVTLGAVERSLRPVRW